MPQTLRTTNVRNDGYVGILIFTLLVLGLGIFLMYQENTEYGFDNAPKSKAPPKVADLLKAPKADPAAPTHAPTPAPAPAPAPGMGFFPPPMPMPVPLAAKPAEPPVPEVAPEPRAVEAVTPKPEAKPAEPPPLQPGFVLPRRK